MLSGIVLVNRDGLRWRDARGAYGPHDPLNSRWKRWRERDVFVRMIEGLAAANAEPEAIIIDATHLKVRRTASVLRMKGDLGLLISRIKGGMNTKLHALADANGRPSSFFMTGRPVSDYTGSAELLHDLPRAQWLLGGRDYDVDWFRSAARAMGIQLCIPGRRSRNELIRYDKRRLRRSSSIDILFVRLKDRRASPPATTAVDRLLLRRCAHCHRHLLAPTDEF